MSAEESAAYSVEMDGSVALVRFDRVARRNLMDSATSRGLTRFMRRAPRDPGVRGIVLTGAGDDFCLGGDAVRDNCVVDGEAVLGTAMDLAQRLAAGPTRSIGLAKRLYRRALDSDITTAFSEERAAIALISTTEDRSEGVQSYVEGRKPEFKGR